MKVRRYKHQVGLLHSYHRKTCLDTPELLSGSSDQHARFPLNCGDRGIAEGRGCGVGRGGAKVQAFGRLRSKVEAEIHTTESGLRERVWHGQVWGRGVGPVRPVG